MGEWGLNLTINGVFLNTKILRYSNTISTINRANYSLFFIINKNNNFFKENIDDPYGYLNMHGIIIYYISIY